MRPGPADVSAEVHVSPEMISLARLLLHPPSSAITDPRPLQRRQTSVTAFESPMLCLALHAELLSETDFLEPCQLVTMSTHVQLRLCDHMEQLAGQPTLGRTLFHLSLILVPTLPLLSDVPPKAVGPVQKS